MAYARAVISVCTVFCSCSREIRGAMTNPGPFSKACRAVGETSMSPMIVTRSAAVEAV